MAEGNSHIDVAAKVLQELDFPLGEEQPALEGQWAVQGFVEAGQDFTLVLLHVPAVLQLQQIEIQPGTRLESHRKTQRVIYILDENTA